MRNYQRDWVRGDVVAGLTVWAVLVPSALAYATIAGVPPVVGLYAAPAALVLYAALGSSRQLITGPSAAAAALSAAVVGNAVAGNGGQFVATTAALAICVGLAALIAGLLRLGFVASFISEPVLKGFIVGLSLTIIAGQVPRLFGVESGSGDFFERVWDFLINLNETDGLTLAVGVGSLAVLFGLPRVAPAIPGPLAAVVLGIGAVELFDLGGHGVAIVGSIKAGLPSLALPDVSLDRFGGLVAAALGVMLVGFAESLGTAKTYAQREQRQIDPNRELIGLGAANLGAGISGGFAVNGSLSKTAVNSTAGGRTQLAGLIVAGLTMLTLLFLTGYFESLPLATLAAIVIAALIDLIDLSALRDFYRVYSSRLGRAYGFAARADFIAAIAAMLGVMIFGTLAGLFVGVLISLLLLLYRASRPPVAELGRVPGISGHFSDLDRHPDNQPVAGIAVLRIEGGLFFANAAPIAAEIRSAARRDDVHAVVIDAETMPFIDVTAVQVLDRVARELRADGVRLVLARNIGQVRDVLDTAPGDSILDASYPTVDEAVKRVLAER
ncbi:MAG TPA: SulP family inorganic anion transporter [Solirubrobacterales bacterium]